MEMRMEMSSLLRKTSETSNCWLTRQYLVVYRHLILTTKQKGNSFMMKDDNTGMKPSYSSSLLIR
ncbi:hypothetical protein EPI10_031389 [Gossypium australe]|uniref:Uncharacterized protein n=1 Tax=Gossypium australe TaxID=47621 RepID=A0A5B6X1G7_9ROSI|nr:hypothetical protein EPI10_031389 [Gossypium australe]